MQFKDIIGQRALKQQFIHEINHEKVSHAQLFLGKNGYGSLALALGFCQYLFCENKQVDDSCGVCPGCIKVSDLQHPDLHFTFPVILADHKTSNGAMDLWREQVKNAPYFGLSHWGSFIDTKGRKPLIGSDESQEIIKKLALKSYEGGYKIMIVWMADEMNPTCSNKLLKILEEPPSKTLFLLVAENQEKLLPTILSRTQLVKIPRIYSDELSLFLRNKGVYPSESIDSVVGRVEGDYLEAIELLTVSEAHDKNREMFILLMRVCYKKDVISMLDWAEKIAIFTRDQQKIFLNYSLHMFRQSLLRNYTENQLTKISEEEDAFLKNFAKFITGNNIHDFMKTFNDANYHIDRNAYSKLLFTNLCFNVMRYIHFA
jgi:DNA polymerase-3 subunit delta'